MATADSNELLAYIDIATVMTPIAAQDGIDLNTGVQVQIKKYKNATRSRHQRDGETFTLTCGREVPMAATHAALIAASDSGDAVSIEVKGTDSGDYLIAGNFKVALTNVQSDTDGEAELMFAFSADGAVTYGAVV